MPPVPLPAALTAFLRKFNDVVKHRAQDALAEDIKDVVSKLIVQENWIAPKIGDEPLLHIFLLLRSDLHPHPPHILEVSLWVAELGTCSRVVPLKLPRAPLPRSLKRKHRGDNHHPKVRHLPRLFAHALHILRGAPRLGPPRRVPHHLRGVVERGGLHVDPDAVEPPIVDHKQIVARPQGAVHQPLLPRNMALAQYRILVLQREASVQLNLARPQWIVPRVRLELQPLLGLPAPEGRRVAGDDQCVTKLSLARDLECDCREEA
mmetsp:Transcript_33130/g.80250  ORF Transcript_33130/g.80250 Transcript_33130/m.80250 type:complete len:263 (-) Transcript_33130:170-958(-)